MSVEIPAHTCCKHCGNGCCIPGHAEPCDQCQLRTALGGAA